MSNVVRFVLSAFAILTSLFLAVRVASADGVTLTVTTPTNVTVAEGDNSQSIDLTLSNNSRLTIYPVFGITPGDTFITGDNSDLGSPGFPYSTTCGVSLGSGSSCTFSFPLLTGNDTGETDDDFGVIKWVFSASYENCPGCATFSVDSGQVYITTYDPGSILAPEPSSLLLLGFGLLGLLALASFGSRTRRFAS